MIKPSTHQQRTGGKRMTNKQKANLKEQIQEDIITYLDGYEYFEPMATDLCQIVVDNFKKLEA